MNERRTTKKFIYKNAKWSIIINLYDHRPCHLPSGCHLPLRSIWSLNRTNGRWPSEIFKLFIFIAKMPFWIDFKSRACGWNEAENNDLCLGLIWRRLDAKTRKNADFSLSGTRPFLKEVKGKKGWKRVTGIKMWDAQKILMTR